MWKSLGYINVNKFLNSRFSKTNTIVNCVFKKGGDVVQLLLNSSDYAEVILLNAPKAETNLQYCYSPLCSTTKRGMDGELKPLGLNPLGKMRITYVKELL